VEVIERLNNYKITLIIIFIFKVYFITFKRNKLNGAVLARSSQPNVGLLAWRLNEDELLIKAIAESCFKGKQLDANGFSTGDSSIGKSDSCTAASSTLNQGSYL
jgi:hypothetical protein